MWRENECLRNWWIPPLHSGRALLCACARVLYQFKVCTFFTQFSRFFTQSQQSSLYHNHHENIPFFPEKKCTTAPSFPKIYYALSTVWNSTLFGTLKTPTTRWSTDRNVALGILNFCAIDTFSKYDFSQTRSKNFVVLSLSRWPDHTTDALRYDSYSRSSIFHRRNSRSSYFFFSR